LLCFFALAGCNSVLGADYHVMPSSAAGGVGGSNAGAGGSANQSGGAGAQSEGGAGGTGGEQTGLGGSGGSSAGGSGATGAGGSGATGAGGSGAGGSGSCSHSPCDVGISLSPVCSQCASAVCLDDEFCCDVQWDADCVDLAMAICGCF